MFMVVLCHSQLIQGIQALAVPGGRFPRKLDETFDAQVDRVFLGSAQE